MKLPGSNRPASVLVFTPTPTHPPIQGNRRRVYDMCQAMQSAGADLTLLYYATEGLSAGQALQMKEAWNELEVVFPRGFVPKHSLVRYPAIDDWFDPAIGEAIRRLCAEKRFDVCVANYVWYSKLFDFLPERTLRVIDTHDVFGGRAQRFEEIGIAPEWYHTSVAQERIGLDRSDFVIAIQDDEAETLAARTRSHVHTVGFLSAPEYLPAVRSGGQSPLRVGYVASANPFNVSSLRSFARAIQASPEFSQACEIHLAGPICSALPSTQRTFHCHGIVDSVTDFLRTVDVVVNPMVGGTGLKIKSLEALSYGKPLVATRDAMVGIPTNHAAHRLANSEEIVSWLTGLAKNPERLPEEADASRRVFEAYRHQQLTRFSSFWSGLEDDITARRASREALLETGIP